MHSRRSRILSLQPNLDFDNYILDDCSKRQICHLGSSNLAHSWSQKYPKSISWYHYPIASWVSRDCVGRALWKIFHLPPNMFIKERATQVPWFSLYPYSRKLICRGCYVHTSRYFFSNDEIVGFLWSFVIQKLPWLTHSLSDINPTVLLLLLQQRKWYNDNEARWVDNEWDLLPRSRGLMWTCCS